MRDTMTFGERLSALMREKRLSVAELTRRMGYRSKTSVVRLLRDEVRYASIEDFMERLSRLGSCPADSAELRALRESMEVSRLGRERYIRYRELWRLVGKPEENRREMQLRPYGAAKVRSIRELAQTWREAAQIRFLMINSGYEGLFRELGGLLSERPDMDAEVEHYLIVRNDTGSAAKQLSALKAVFPDTRYHGFCRTLSEDGCSEGVGYGLNGDAVLVSGRYRDGREFCQMLTVLSDEEGLLYEIGEADEFPAFFRKSVERLCRDALPLKTQYPEQELLSGLIAISKRYLECEEDRATCCLAPNVCFELIPYEILYRVMFDSVLQGANPTDGQIEELSRIQMARYANIHGKKKPTAFIFDWVSMKRFYEIGYTTDHVTGMRAFTKEERKAILSDVVSRARWNGFLHVHLLKPDVRVRGMTLTAYEGLGVYLLDAYTQYDVIKGHSEVFLPMPDFAAALQSFFKDELIEKYCYSEEESLAMLEQLAEEE